MNEHQAAVRQEAAKDSMIPSLTFFQFLEVMKSNDKIVSKELRQAELMLQRLGQREGLLLEGHAALAFGMAIASQQVLALNFNQISTTRAHETFPSSTLTNEWAPALVHRPSLKRPRQVDDNGLQAEE